MNRFSWNQLPRPIVALSPMADMTDSAFCRVVKSMASPVVFREMVSAQAVVHGNEKTLAMTDIHADERPLIQQIFGADADVMAEAARKIEEEHHPEGIDINMGCPVYKIVHNFNGACLMREPKRAASIISKVKAAVSVPVSVKIRTGWSDPTECLEFCKVVEDAGADLITIHGRTKAQGYSGLSDWDMIRQVKERVSIPVLANGDIHTAPLAFTALEQTKCDGVLIARGALGNPWIFSEIEKILPLYKGEEERVFGCQPSHERIPFGGKSARIASNENTVPMEKRLRVIRQHAAWHCELYGERGIVTFRKHLTWYLKGIPESKALREQLHTAQTHEAFLKIMDELEQPAYAHRHSHFLQAAA